MMWHPPQQPVIRHRFLRQPYSLILLLLLLLALCIFVWLVVHPPRSVFPAIPGEDAIAFESGRDPGQQIYVMRADGMYPTRLTYNVRHATGWLWFLPLIFGDLVINTAPAQSPTGHGIIFLSNVTGDYAFYHLTLVRLYPFGRQNRNGRVRLVLIQLPGRTAGLLHLEIRQ